MTRKSPVTTWPGPSVAAGHVGGDYFDFIRLKDNRWAFALGDVSGKGVPAALLMANLQATLRSQVLQDTSCHLCVSNCNRLMYPEHHPRPVRHPLLRSAGHSQQRSDLLQRRA